MDYEKMQLKRCPFCGNEVSLRFIQFGAAIVCNSRNCLGGLTVKWGTCDSHDIFLAKLVNDWNNREPDSKAVGAAVKCLEAYRAELLRSMREPYAEFDACCLDVLDEAINRVGCFTCDQAVLNWNNK